MESTLIIILLAASLIFNIVTMILIIGLVKKNKSMTITKEQSHSGKTNIEPQKQYVDESGVVFCRNCANQFDSTLKVCPDCKTAR